MKYNWDLVLRKLNIEGGSICPITKNELRQFEDLTHFKLPLSYSEFCLTIGPGKLVRPTNYSICVPRAKQEHFDLIAFNRMMKVVEGIPFEIQPQFSRAWLFAVDIGNRIYFWDTAEVTRPDDNECAIYVLSDYEDVLKLSDTFWGFINDTCLSAKRPDNTEREIELVFKPGI